MSITGVLILLRSANRSWMSGEVLEERKPGTRPRVSSAKARLSTPPEQTPWDDGQVMQEYQQRVKSAALIRDAHTRTGKSMFKPPSEKKAEKQERYSTSYSNHYTGTAVRPPSARPSSPTRRNNPHPTQVGLGGVITRHTQRNLSNTDRLHPIRH